MPNDPSSQPLTDEALAQMRARSVDPYFPYIGQMLKDVPLLLDEVDRLRSELHEAHRTASAEGGRAAALEAVYRQTRTERDARDTEIERLRAENTAQAGVLGEIAAERTAQFAKFGEQNHVDGTGPRVITPDRLPYMEDQAEVARFDCQTAAEHGYLDWLHILREEVYEAFAESDPAALRAELVQVAAVAVAWVEAIDRRALGLNQDGSGQ